MSRQPQGKSLSQPTSRVGNLEWRRRDAIPAQRGSGSGTQRTESGSSYSTRTLPAESSSSHGTQSSGRSSSPPQTTRRPTSRPAKRARRRTLQTTAYSAPEGQPDAQQQIARVRLRDESSDQYQNSRRSDKTESDTEPDATMMSRMTTLDQGLVTDPELQTDDKQISGFQRCEFRAPPDLKELCKSGAPKLLGHV